jgi:mannose-6-phosphate isomerase-like protein (cupin superfamily)
MVMHGVLRIDLREKTLRLSPVEMIVIPKGVEHEPSFIDERTVLLIEHAATLNTGDAGGDPTDTHLDRI